MYWQLRADTQTTAPEDVAPEGRFVLHRHHDADGPHLDLRLEQDAYLMGWRVDGAALDDAWATEKAPHPTHWLEQDGDCVREDAGTYAWLDHDGQGGALLLRGERGDRVIRVVRAAGLPAAAVRDLCDALRRNELEAVQAAALIDDGVAARRRAVERFCGLGRELDGSTFDESVWRKTFEACTLREIQQHLHSYEVRFDAKYPPQPVSQPEPLEEPATRDNIDRAMAILHA